MAINNFRVLVAGEDLGEFHESALTLDDAFTIEATAGITINEMLAGIAPMRAKSLRALVWFMKFKRGDQDHITTIAFKLTEFTIEAIPDPTVAGPSEGSETPTSDSSPTSAT